MRLTSEILLILMVLCACTSRVKQEAYEVPWGDESGESDELIMLTIYGPETYYEYHGKDMGTNYQLCERLAQHLGKRVRIDVCKDTADMLQRLRDDEGDVIAVPLDKSHREGFVTVANDWAVNEKSQQLAEEIRSWYKPKMIAEIREQQQYQLSVASVTRRIFPIMLSASKGQISQYDAYFCKYAPLALVDWAMLAAQCYQESCFDTQARSWAGACGLMQIMPATADHLGLPREQLFQPEPNIAAAARYMRELQMSFQDVNNPSERLRFALAAYNGGVNHVRDAMALAKKYGGAPQRWADVRRYILLLQEPRYYNDAVVHSGYMRGSETAQYVDAIMQRHTQYRTALATGKSVASVVTAPQPSSVSPSTVSPIEATPHRAAKKNKWRKE
ncbi:MAG: transglycosylase SLT domain-containing protein [Prevotella sp.]|nr:transglycosylase SLT domain-containing protein [Prevotella sp.]